MSSFIKRLYFKSNYLCIPAFIRLTAGSRVLLYSLAQQKLNLRLHAHNPNSLSHTLTYPLPLCNHNNMQILTRREKRKKRIAQLKTNMDGRRKFFNMFCSLIQLQYVQAKKQLRCFGQQPYFQILPCAICTICTNSNVSISNSHEKVLPHNVSMFIIHAECFQYHHFLCLFEDAIKVMRKLLWVLFAK